MTNSASDTGSLGFARGGSLSLFGPVLFYDVVRTARRSRYFISRCAYLGVLTAVLCWMYGLWMMRYRDQAIPPAEMATFAEWFFYVYLVVQFLVVLLVTPAYTAGAISEEKERRTMEFLLATDLRNREIVLGKFTARVGNLLLLLLAGLPILSFIQLIGGIDPDLLLGGFAATALTLVELASLSILFSVYTRRSRDAILLVYFAVGIYWGLAAALLTFRSNSYIVDYVLVPGALPYRVENLLWHVNSGNPFVMLHRVAHELQAGTSLATCLMTLGRDYAVFCLMLSLICCTWAVARVRTVALRQVQGGTPRVRRYPHHWGRPGVGNDPMLWKEIFEPGLRFNWLGRIVSLLIAVFVIAPVSTILLDTVSPGGAGFWNYADAIDVWLRGLVAAACSFMLLGVAVRAAGSLSGERDIRTLDGLLTTPLSSNAILFAKWIGAIAGMRWAWFLLLAAWGLGVYCGKLHLWVFPLLFLAWLIYAAFLAQLGLWFSLLSPTTLRATIRTLLATVGLGLGHWLLWFYYLPLFLHLDDHDLNPLLLKDIHLGLTPPAVLTMLTFETQWGEARLLSREFWQPAAVVFLGLGLTVLATFGLFLWTRRRFRVLCARTPFLQPEGGPETMALPSRPLPLIPRLLRRRPGFSVALILLPIVALVAIYYYATTLSDRRLAAAMATIEATDPRWKFFEIEADRKQYEDEENGALYAIEARSKIPRNWPPYPKAVNGEMSGGFGPAGNKPLDEYVAIPPEQQLDYWQTKDLRAALDQVKDACDQTRALVRYPGGRIPVNWAPDIFSTVLPNLQEIGALANLMQFEAKLRAQDGDPDGALLSARATLHVGRTIGDEQIMISQLVRIAIQGVSIKMMERVLAQGEPSEEALKALQDLLEDEVQQPQWIVCLRGERAAFHDIVEQTRKGKVDPSLFGGESVFLLGLVSRSSHLFGLKWYLKLFEIAKLPLHDQETPMNRLESELKSASPLQTALARQLLPAVQKVFQAIRRTQASLRCAMVTLAAERYRRQHGRWPDSLNELAPTYLKEVPIDPFSGTPLLMRRLEDGLVIYSVWVDGVDNQGKLDNSQMKPGTDFGYRLWDVARRRQPPRNPEMGPPALPPEQP